MSDIQTVAQRYLDHGFAIVPLVKGEKRASASWRNKTYTAQHFKPDDGIALKCGEQSGWRVDVDLDCPEAIIAARELLPLTQLVHGRPSKLASHYWFVCEGIKTAQFKDADAMLVEIRSTNGYTAAPPSIHPSGEVLAWEREGAPMPIERDVLYNVVRDVAITALLARHWPSAGRHHMVGPLAGFLCQAGVENVVRIIELAATIAGDTEVSDRVKFAQSTVAKFATDKDAKLTAGPTLAELIGSDVVARLRSWLKLADLDAIEDMNTRHFWVRMGKDDVIGREDTANGEVVFQRPKALYSEYADRQIQVGLNKKGEPVIKPLFQAWLESPLRRRYQEVVFAPPPVPCRETDYNLWRGFAIEPKAGDCSLFMRHIREVICSGNDEHYEFLLNLLAFTMQKPGLPSEVATILRGEPGTGKGTFVRALSAIFGPHAVQLDNTKHLVGGFNAAISGKVIVFADEALWAGDKRSVGALKRLVTEPTLTIERKGIDVAQETNCIHLFVATNEEWSIPAMLKERRYLALHVSSRYRNDRTYFDALQTEIDNGGIAAFLHDMLTRSVDRGALRNPPITDELRNQQEETMAPEIAWLMDVLDSAQFDADQWPMWLRTRDLYDAYKANNTSRIPLSAQSFAKRIGPVISAQPPQVHRFSSRDVSRAFYTRSLAEARRAFDDKRGSQTDWAQLPPSQPRVP